ncbi:MAG: phosphoribosyltransferase [Parcubacteria group bacterium]|nr:phosphoribosyltransferase [Parcubacteria group bacterium]
MYETEKWLVYEQKDFNKDIQALVFIIKYCTKLFDGIFGIPEGANVLAAYLHYRLKLPIFRTPEEITENTIIVDDIADTGATLTKYVKDGSFVVTLFYHKQSIFVPSIWLHEKHDKWVHFPWEDPEDGDDRLVRD